MKRWASLKKGAQGSIEEAPGEQASKGVTLHPYFIMSVLKPKIPEIGARSHQIFVYIY